MPVSDQHKQYSDNLPKWQRVRDCVDGEDAIKKRSAGGGSGNTDIWGLQGTAYLPPPNPDDNSLENKQRFEAYRMRASFKNFTGSTLEGMKGLAFRIPPVLDLPTGLEYLNVNANGEGLNLSQVIQKALGEVAVTGRQGWLVEYPQAEEGLTQQQVNTLGLKAWIKPYSAESIKNWRESIINGVKVVTLIVLSEQVEKVAPDGFSVECVEYHRVLQLIEGVYTQMLFDEDDNLVESVGDNGIITPRKSDGSTWERIPFIFIGSEDNDPNVDKSLLIDIANVNIAHYRNSADNEESSYQVGQPTIALAGLTQSWVDDVLGGKVQMGSRGGVLLPDGGSAQLLQANPNQMPGQGMKDKQAEMVALGARIIQDRQGQETAEGAKIRFAGQNSKLGVVINNIENATKEAVILCGMFVGVDGEAEISLNRQFYEATIDPQLIAQHIQMLDRGAIAMADFRHNLRKANLIAQDRTDEDIDTETGEADPLT